jgi:UDP-N-acetylglucosamine 1-carboxyvinyltransferase
LHIKGLRALGAKIRVRRSCIYAHARRLRGARINLAGPHGSTVLGTANVMMAATLAEGRTVIEGAACEPETQDLARFLNACGALISGVGTRTLTVDGVERLQGAEYSIIPDRIEAGTFLAAVAAAGGSVTLEGARPDHMRANIEALERMGVEVRIRGDALAVARSEPLKAIEFATAPYPGVPTDVHPQLSVLLCLAEGKSTVREGVYPRRFTYVTELNRMGACISHRGAIAMIQGVPALHGAAVHAADLRTGAALVLAGLAAHGGTVITGVDQIDRGHQALEQRLRAVGADIHRRQSEAAGYATRKSA